MLIVDTTLLGELEQFLLNTVVARSLFALRRALRLADSPERLRAEIASAFGVDEESGRIGQRSLVAALLERLERGALPYIVDGRVRTPDELPLVHILVEEAPSVLNPARMRFGSVFRDISRQGRKFGIGLGVVSQQVSEIDAGSSDSTQHATNDGTRQCGRTARGRSSRIVGHRRLRAGASGARPRATVAVVEPSGHRAAGAGTELR